MILSGYNVNNVTFGFINLASVQTMKTLLYLYVLYININYFICTCMYTVMESNCIFNPSVGGGL